MQEPHYVLFQGGVFKGKYTRPQWRKLKPEDIFNAYVYLTNSKVWYYSAWGSLIPLNNSDIPNEIKAFQLLMNIDDL